MRSLVPALTVGLVVLAAGAHAPPASACAILPIDNPRAPRLSLERVAILYDEARQTEHFVREVRFDGASAAFAFVVPTPSRPEVAAVVRPPFDALEQTFPLEPPPQAAGGPEPGAKSAAPMRASVTVLSEQRVGKFTAFVLAANDAAGLERWLGDNRIVLPPGGRPWLDHYVGLSFFFTAFRYEAPGRPAPTPADRPAPGQFATPPPSNGVAPPEAAPPERTFVVDDTPASLTSETVRLTFRTPLPFYPYLEPARADPGAGAPHTMQVWLVSHDVREPRLRRFATSREPRWAWAWQARLAYEADGADVARAFGELGNFVGGGTLRVQTFRDERANRDGFGDVVFPPADTSLDGGAFVATATPLLGDLGRGLHVGAPEPDEGTQEERFRVLPSAGGCACRVGPTRDERDGALGALALLVAAAAAFAGRRHGRQS